MSGRTTPDASGSAQVAAYLLGQPEPAQSTLRTIRGHLLQRLPRAEEGMAYGMPAVLLDGTAIAGYAGFARHCSYFPMSGSVVEAMSSVLAAYDTAKGTIRFPVDHPLPARVISSLVAARLAELSSVTHGVRREYFPDGALKAEGRMRNGELHGEWQWWRRDGSLMRTGSFVAGEQVGVWRTYDATGRLVTQKDLSRRR